jgi:hypothetical protein
MLYGSPLSAPKVLRRLLIYKVQQDWKNWQVSLANHKGTLQEYGDLIAQEVPPSPSVFLHRFGNAFYKLLAKDIRSSIGNQDQPSPTFSWLREFTASPNKQRSKHKSQGYVKALCQYIGFDNQTHFHYTYELYQRLTQTTQAFRVVLQNNPQFYQQVDDMFALYEQEVKALLPQPHLQQLAELKLVSASNYALSTSPIEEWTVQKLFAEAAKQKTPLEWIHEVVYAQNVGFEAIEQVATPDKKRLLPRILLVAIVVGVIAGGAWFGLGSRQPRVLTQAELDQISWQILDIEQAQEGNATVQIAYDASKLGNNKAIKKLGLRLQGSYPVSSHPLTKAQDTVLLVYEAPGKHPVQIKQKNLHTDTSVYLPSADWFAIAASEQVSTWHSKVIPKKQASQNSQFIFPKYFMPQYAHRYFYTHYRYVKPTHIPIGDFSIEIKAKIHTDSLLNATCFESTLELSSDQDKRLTMKILNNGCSRWAVIHFGGKYDNINYVNQAKKLMRTLKPFIRPLAKLQAWHTLKMQVKDGVAHYYFNGQRLHSQHAPNLHGNINYIGATYKGLGAIDYVKVWDGTGKLIYKEDFDRKKP